MNASVPTGFREVVGIPCGHVILVDSSSKVTIFSRGFRRSAFGGGGGGQRTVFDGDRLIIGISKSVIPAMLNSLTDLGTKYSNLFSGFPVDRRIGVFRWKYDLLGSELYCVRFCWVMPTTDDEGFRRTSVGRCQDFGDIETNEISSFGGSTWSCIPIRLNHKMISV